MKLLRLAPLLLTCLAGTDAAAQSAGPSRPTTDRAQVVLEGVQGFYRNLDHLAADFRQVSVNATFGKKTESSGKVYLKPGKMRWDYFSKREKNKVSRSQMSDGTMIWAVDVPGKWYFKQKLADSTLPVAVTFMTGRGQLAKEFNARLLRGTSFGGPGIDVIELTPKKPSAQFKRLVLVVDPASFRVMKSIVTTATGDTNEFSFFDVDTTKPIADRLFVFNPQVAKGFRQISAKQAPR